MSNTVFVSPERVALFLGTLGERLKPEFIRFYAAQKVGDQNARITKALELALYQASDGVIKFKAAPGGGLTFGFTADPATAPTVGEEIAQQQATPGTTRPYKGLDIKTATPQQIEEHANGLHLELQGVSERLRAGKPTPQQIEQFDRYVQNAQHFYDAVCERAEASEDHDQVQALLNFRVRRLHNDLASYHQMALAAKL